MVIFDIKQEPVGTTYEELLRCGVQFCNQFFLVVRSEADLDEKGKAALGALSDFYISSERTNRWPGTELVSGSAQLYRYSLNAKSIDELTRDTGGLFGWIAPSRPEDLCLLRPTGDAWLTTISHERDAYLSLVNDEEEIVAKSVPGLVLARNKSYQ
jgi:hypothetical protein